MKSLTKRRVEVSLFPLVVLLGIACGLMFCAFLLGYSTGNKVGFSEAREASLNRMAKFPIDEVVDEDITRKERVDAYLKLENSETKESKKEATLAKGKEVKKEKKDSILLNDLLVKKKKNKKEAAVEVKKDVQENETIGSLIAKKKEVKEKETSPSIELVKEKESKKIAILKDVAKEEVKKEEPLKVKKKVDQSKFLVKKVTPGWYAQVAAPTSIDEANILANKLHSSGFRLVIEKAEINGNTYYRVLVGSESNKTQALRLVEQLSRESYIDSTPFVRRMS